MKWKLKNTDDYWTIGFDEFGGLNICKDWYDPERKFCLQDIRDNNYFQSKSLAQAALKKVKKVLKKARKA